MAPEMGQARVGIDHDVVLKTFDSPLSTYKRKDDLVTIARALQIVVESKDTITALSKKTRARMDEDPTIAQNSRFSALFGEPCRGQRSKHVTESSSESVVHQAAGHPANTRYAHHNVEFSKGQGASSVGRLPTVKLAKLCLLSRVTGPRLSVQRLRTLQQKKEAQAKSARRDIAVLLEKGKWLETFTLTRLLLATTSDCTDIILVINDDINLELLELLELYCELLIARFGLLDQSTREPDPGISEGVCAIIYSATRTEVKELQTLREFLMHKYGREFSIAVMENRGQCVSDRVIKKLSVETPSPELVEGYLAEIAKGYAVKWTARTFIAKAEVPEDRPSKDITHAAPAGEPSEQLPAYSEQGAKDGVPKLPDIPPTEDENEKRTQSIPDIPKDSPEDDFDALTRRFHALKKR
ncbi:regulator of Vps4 activity in the MVB pathway-domain-containing protein [Scleroderma yunnanense]